MVSYQGHQFAVEILEQGYDDYSAMKQQVIQTSQAFMIAIDTSKSFDELCPLVDAWYQLILQVKKAPTCGPLLLVGCKSDVAINAMIHQQWQQKAQQMGTHYIATSAKLGTHVVQAFEQLYAICDQTWFLQPPNATTIQNKCLVQ